MPALNALAAKPYDGSRTYSDVVHFTQIYVVEAHPMSPDPSPYTGTVWELGYSTKPQAHTYAARKLNAMDVVPLITGNQRLLVDDLRPHGLDNPLWCTYGPCPNCTFLISQDGRIEKVQYWFDATDIEAAIDDLLSRTEEVDSTSRTGILVLLFSIEISACIYSMKADLDRSRGSPQA